MGKTLFPIRKGEGGVLFVMSLESYSSCTDKLSNGDAASTWEQVNLLECI